MYPGISFPWPDLRPFPLELNKFIVGCISVSCMAFITCEMSPVTHSRHNYYFMVFLFPKLTNSIQVMKMFWRQTNANKLLPSVSVHIRFRSFYELKTLTLHKQLVTLCSVHHLRCLGRDFLTKYRKDFFLGWFITQCYIKT